jgi:hypothetical protein
LATHYVGVEVPQLLLADSPHFLHIFEPLFETVAIRDQILYLRRRFSERSYLLLRSGGDGEDAAVSLWGCRDIVSWWTCVCLFRELVVVSP